MIKIKTLEVSGFTGAILGMRDPYKNREKSDSDVMFHALENFPKDDPRAEAYRWWNEEYGLNFMIGPKDLELAHKLLATGGDDDSKFMRMIHVQADVTAPLYWWKEYDTYKVATVANSESTMHTIHKMEFAPSDFSHDMLLDDYTIDEDWELEDTNPDLLFVDTIDTLNMLRKLYLDAVSHGNQSKAKDYWYNMIQLLPTSYMQKRTIDLNYQTLRNIYFARKNHKLAEWSGSEGFCEWITQLPYASELITYKPLKVFTGIDLDAFYVKRQELRECGLTDAEIQKWFCMNTVFFREICNASARKHLRDEKEKNNAEGTSNNSDS